MMASGDLVVTLFADNTALVTSQNGSYRVNGVCHCKAAQFGDAKRYHRIAKRLQELIEEVASVAVPSRESLIAEIKSIWPKTWPPLAIELIARFRVNTLNYPDDESLRRVRLAIAM